MTGIEMTVAAREIVTIAGTNGSGKSTLAKAVMGFLPRTAGTIRFDGIDLLAQPAEKRLALGIAYVPQVANIFPSLSVEENLLVIENVADRRARLEAMYAHFPALKPLRRRRAGSLSGGERQQVAFARTLMPEPKLMVLDEPTAALSPAIVSKILALIRTLPEAGVAVLLVEQRAREALAISDRGYILDQGRIVLADTAAALLSDTRMAELYLGHGLTESDKAPS
nr:ABC transporter ATP-binding protein [Acuticoccus kalidii]